MIDVVGVALLGVLDLKVFGLGGDLLSLVDVHADGHRVLADLIYGSGEMGSFTDSMIVN